MKHKLFQQEGQEQGHAVRISTNVHQVPPAAYHDLLDTHNIWVGSPLSTSHPTPHLPATENKTTNQARAHRQCQQTAHTEKKETTPHPQPHTISSIFVKQASSRGLRATATCAPQFNTHRPHHVIRASTGWHTPAAQWAQQQELRRIWACPGSRAGRRRRCPRTGRRQ